MKKVFYFLFILLLTLQSCHKTEESSKKKVSSSTTPKKQTKKESTKEEPEELFDVEKFKKQTDSLLSKILRVNINTKYKVKTLTSQTNQHPAFQSMIKDRAIVKHHTFDTGKGYKRFSLFVIEAKYKGKSDTDSVFLHLKQMGAKNGTSSVPGLTYTNDFLTRSNNNIYWINSSCSYAYFNHEKIKELMIQSITNFKKKDSIRCRCGVYCL